MQRFKQIVTSFLVAIGFLYVAQAAPPQRPILVYTTAAIHAEIEKDARCTVVSTQITDKATMGTQLDVIGSALETKIDKVKWRISNVQEQEGFAYRLYKCDIIGTGVRTHFLRDRERAVAEDYLEGPNSGMSWKWDKEL